MPYFCLDQKCTGLKGNRALSNKGVEKKPRDGFHCPDCGTALVFRKDPKKRKPINSVHKNYLGKARRKTQADSKREFFEGV